MLTKKTFFFLLLLVLLVSTVLADPCEINSKNQPQNIPCLVTIEKTGSCEEINLTIWNLTSIVEQKSFENYSELKCAASFNQKNPGTYQLSYSNSSRVDLLVVEADKMIIAVIILLPVILGIFLLVGAVTMNQEHWQVKIFLYLLSLITFFASFHAGIISLVKYYDFPELQEFVGVTSFWTGIIFFVLTTYFILIFLIWIVHYIAQKKQEKLQY